MPKIILTIRDIEDLCAQGTTTITLADDMLLTAEAYEQAKRLGMRLVSTRPDIPPAAPVRPYLSTSLPDGQEFAPAAGAPPGPQTDTARNVLRFTPQYDEEALRAAIIETGRIAYRSGLMISNDGNISARLPDGNILITPSGVCKGRIGPRDLLVIDPDGRVVKPAADRALKPTSEQPMHLEVYHRRPDVRAVIHTHLIFANAMVIARGGIRMDVIPEAAVAFGSVPVTDYSMPASRQNAEAIRELITTHNVILIRNHGSLTVGKDLDEALIHLERLEHIAKTLTYAELLGGAQPLPKEMLEAIEREKNENKKPS
jgi:L-fuculose-phosphate aldolase